MNKLGTMLGIGVLVGSSATAQERLWSVEAAAGEVFRETMELPDVDGDGAPELGVYVLTNGGVGSLRALSGADRSVLWSSPSLMAVADYRLVPLPVHRVSDRDGDGHGDLAAFSLREELLIFSSADGRPLHTLPTTACPTMVVPGDLNGDGVEDFVFGAPQLDRVDAVDGASGQRLWRHEGMTRSLGASLAAMDDVDGDGVPDLLVGAPEMTHPSIAASGQIHALSGASGGFLYRAILPRAEFFGLGIDVVDDVDGDGRRDFVSQGSKGRYQDIDEIALMSGAGGGVLVRRSLGVDPCPVPSDQVEVGADVSGDGVSDLFLRPSSYRGRVAQVLSGRTLATLCHAGEPGVFGGGLLQDLNGDGTHDLVSASLDETGVSTLSADALPALFLQIEPADARPQQMVTLTVCETAPRLPLLLTIEELNGVSTRLAPFGILRMGRSGELRLQARPDFRWRGLEISLRAHVLDPVRGLRPSARGTLRIE